MSEPKVLVAGCFSSLKPASIPAFLKALKGISYKNKEIFLLENGPSKTFLENFSLKKIHIKKAEFIENQNELIVETRNKLRDFFLEKEFDYFLSVEQNIVVPENIIEKLLSHNKKVCSATYFFPRVKVEELSDETTAKTVWFSPFLWKIGHQKNKSKINFKVFEFNELFPSKLLKVGACGLGCVLIHKSVLEKIKFKTDSKKLTDHINFALDCIRHDFEIWADTSVVCKRINF